ncbi:uncharacterized protein PHACADRAFT_257436 [Phanerochaete carnosa HHB-10118-sp]|uniref:Nucleoplasmin-like domain-containing protein n=1 Tax=Phanerochaete carnosa (strain HHB-10118-sp) TaxID=650164 RepID=K5W4R2_PHACS|nr:uncharacterized protein PHACADRAFT_257436 [Phanerochaete carnosa HHB-10118-sp]EKM53929.1 hypothetical protein PHACADRAFT_257436 [Phanerochaete carnosa HHB-10118-sp]
MAVAIAIWSMIIQANDSVEFELPASVRITSVALGADLQDETERTTLRLVYIGMSDSQENDEEDEEPATEPIATVLCSLTPGKIEQAKIDLVLEGNETFVFEAIGKNTLYLSGNYIEQKPVNMPPDEDEIVDEEEEVFRLEDVSSDVEVEVDEMDEEDAPELLPPPSPPKAKAQKSNPKKRSLEEENTEPAAEQQLSKKQRKKSKKLEAEVSDAVPAVQPAQEKKQEHKHKHPEQKKAGDDGQQDEGTKKRKKNKGDKAKL